MCHTLGRRRREGYLSLLDRAVVAAQHGHCARASLHGIVFLHSALGQWLLCVWMDLITPVPLHFPLSEVEKSLLVLPFSYIPDLLTLFNEYIQVGTEVELFCRALLFLLR